METTMKLKLIALASVLALTAACDQTQLVHDNSDPRMRGGVSYTKASGNKTTLGSGPVRDTSKGNTDDTTGKDTGRGHNDNRDRGGNSGSAGSSGNNGGGNTPDRGNPGRGNSGDDKGRGPDGSQNDSVGRGGHTGGVGNPGNDKDVGKAGESPNGKDFGGGSRGRSDAAPGRNKQ